MEQTWRWFGPDDAVELAHIRQAGARGIVTALHHIPYGVTWSREEIAKRKAEIEADTALGLKWSVVESLPVAEAIKLGEGDLTALFENYRQSIRNLAAAGLRIICYNFMPVVDWVRTELQAPIPGGGTVLRFNAREFAAFDVFMLGRAGAEADYPPQVVAEARSWFDRASEADRHRLLSSIMAGLPGAYDRYDIPGLQQFLGKYRHITKERLRKNLSRFLREILPTCEECGVRMAIHPDDPPRSLLGLPRIVSSEDDIAFILETLPSPANGLTLCTGSLGAGAHNDVPAIARRFADRIYFAHLRNVKKEPDGSFAESEHLNGDVDLVSVVDILLAEQTRRREAGDSNWRIPFRPDHGHQLLDDVNKPTHPGYPAIGRLKGLAELRGVIAALAAVKGYPVSD